MNGWRLIDNRRPSTGLLVLLIFFAVSSAVPAPAAPEISTGGGLHLIRFGVDAGQLVIGIPSDLRRGDRFSGKLAVIVKGDTSRTREKNRRTMLAYRLEIDGDSQQTSQAWGRWTVSDSGWLNVRLKNDEGKTVAETRIPLTENVPSKAGPAFSCPSVATAGGLIEISGSFDGDFSNTVARMGKKSLSMWAESPRRLIVSSPGDELGTKSLSVNEGGKTNRCVVRNIGLSLAAHKSRLRSNEEGSLEITVSGLDGLDQPLSLRLRNRTPDVVTLQTSEEIMIHPRDVGPGGTYSTERSLVGIKPGPYEISASIVTEKDCEEIRRTHKDVNDRFRQRERACRDMKQELNRLKDQRAEAERAHEANRRNKRLIDSKLTAAENKLDRSRGELKGLIDFALHSDEVGSESAPGLRNSVGLFDGDVRIYFSGSQSSVNLVSWFLNEYREKWQGYRDEARKAAREMERYREEKAANEKKLQAGEKRLQDLEQKLQRAEAGYADCLKHLDGLDRQLNKLESEFRRCLQRLKEQRESETALENAETGVQEAEADFKEAYEAIRELEDEAEKLDEVPDAAVEAGNEARHHSDKSQQHLETARDTLDRARQAYEAGQLDKAVELAEEALREAESAERAAESAREKTTRAAGSVKLQKSREERARKAEEERDRMRERERMDRERRAREWWDEFLRQEESHPGEIRGGKKNLAIGIHELLDNHITDLITGTGFNPDGCEGRCLIALSNTFGQQYGQLLVDLAWDVFWGTIGLPARVASMTAKVSFAVFKGLVSRWVKSNTVVPLWGKYRYSHPYGSFKHMSVGSFTCEMESFLVYNKQTGYVMGMVLCDCCGRVTTLYLKYRVDENGRALDRPAPIVEFR